MFVVAIVIALAASAHAFTPVPASAGFRTRMASKMMNSEPSTLLLSELFSSPTARYNGELISPSIKVVAVPPKPANYEYGAVSADSGPALFGAAILVIALTAAVPAFLSIGESAKKQQATFEDENKIGYNAFAAKARQEKEKASIKVAPKKTPAPVVKVAPAKSAAAGKKVETKPAVEVKKPSSNPFGGFFGKK